MGSMVVMKLTSRPHMEIYGMSGYRPVLLVCMFFIKKFKNLLSLIHVAMFLHGELSRNTCPFRSRT